MEGIKTMLLDKKARHEAVVDSFTAARDEAKKTLAEEVMLQVTVLKNDLAASNEEIEDLLSVLDETQVMSLTETDVHHVWSGVERQIPERAGWIDSLAEGLEVAEEQRRVKVEAALVAMVDQMGGVAHISEGEVERILEKESLSLNLDILNNRRAYADLVTRLQVSEVELEKKRKAEWAAGLSRWRILRTHQAMKSLRAIIESPDFSEPSERLALYSYLRERQSSAYESIVSHVQHVAHLAPPYLSSKKVNGWMDEAHRRLDIWARDSSEILSKIASHEDKVEAAAQNHLSSMISHVLGYKGFNEQECMELADKECGSVIKQRRQAALELIDQTHKFLAWQLEEWRSFTSALFDWLKSLALLFEEHKLKTNENEKEVRAQLKAKRESFEAEDAAREADLEASLTALSQGHSEQALDDLVTASLACLDKIEGGYRDFHSAMSMVAKGFPITVQRANVVYHLQLCENMFIKPLVAPPEPSAEELAANAQKKAEEEEARLAAEAEALRVAAEAEAAASKGKKPSGAKKGAAAAAAAPPPAPPSAPPPTVLEPASPPASPKVIVDNIVLPDGSAFGMFKLMINVIMGKSSDILRAEMLRRWNVAKEEKRAERKAKYERERAERDAAAAAHNAEADIKKMKSMKRVVQTASTLAAPVPIEEPIEEEPDQGAEDQALVPPPPPVDLYGRPHCQSLLLPPGLLSHSLKELQMGLLREMQDFAILTYDKSSEWADQRESALTEELEAHLRDHRPRAGRIEEETRLGRSVELVAQRRKAEGHFRLQSKAVKAQAEQYSEWERALIAQVDKSVAKLRNYEAFLGQSMSIKGIDIRKREAEALRAKIERDLGDSIEELEDKVKASCDRLCDTNRSFDSTTLKTFDEGGHYSPENVAMYRQSLAGIDAHVAKTQSAQIDRLKTVQADLVKKAEEALEYVMSLLPSHKEDMELLEKLDALMETARRKAGGELGKSAKDSALINEELDNLERLLHGAEKQQAQWKQQHLSGGSSDRTDYGAPLGRCKEILSSLDRLRFMLFKQGKALNFLQSSGLTISPINLSLDADGELPVNPPSSAPPPPVNAKSTGGAKPSASPVAAPPPAPSGSEAEALARDMEAAIDSCRKEAEILAKAYYTMMFPPPPAAGGGKGAKDAPKKPSSPVGAKKGAAKAKEPEPLTEEDTGVVKPIRPIRYPSRIPLKLEEMINWMDGILEGLRDQLNSHVAAGVKELRTQVIRAYRLVERTPASALALLTRHELKAVGVRHRSLLKKYDEQRSDILQQVEAVRSALHPRMTNPSWWVSYHHHHHHHHYVIYMMMHASSQILLTVFCLPAVGMSWRA